MNTPVIALPIADPGMALRCLRSMAPEVWPNVVVIDNSGLLRSMPFVREIIRPGENAGTAAAWNLVREIALAEDRPLCLLSAAVLFGAPGGADLLALEPPDGVQSWWPAPTLWHTVLFLPDLLREVGSFDENCYPYHYEDTDIRRRIRLSGGVEREHGTIDAVYTRTGHGGDALRRRNPGARIINLPAIAAYYADKWGGPPDAETFTTPYGLDKSLSWWPPTGGLPALRERYGLDA